MVTVSIPSTFLTCAWRSVRLAGGIFASSHQAGRTCDTAAACSRLLAENAVIWWLAPVRLPSSLSFMSPLSGRLPSSRQPIRRLFRHARHNRHVCFFPATSHYTIRRRTITLCASPTPARNDSSDVPPELIKGRVRPVTGKILKFIPMETEVWKKIIAATP